MSKESGGVKGPGQQVGTSACSAFDLAWQTKVTLPSTDLQSDSHTLSLGILP